MKVSSLTVVQGIFKQTDPGFVDGGYDLLGDSFGLIDQEGDRWGKFKRYVYLPPFPLSLDLVICLSAQKELMVDILNDLMMKRMMERHIKSFG
jgi:hypothetical protein